jgi:hypothetical protein
MSNTISFNDNAGTYIANGTITTNELDVNGNITALGLDISGNITTSGNIQAQQVDVSGNITAIGNITSSGNMTTSQIDVNGDVNLTGSIINGSNAIYFNEEYKFIDIPENTHVYGTFFLDYGGVTYNVGDIISQGTSGTYASYPSITYDASSNTTTFTGAMVFPSTSIASTAINNTSFLTLTTNQNVSGSKTYSVSQIFTSDIRLVGALVLNTNTLSIPNSTLQNIQYLSGLTSNVNTNIIALQTKTTNMSFAGSTTTFTGTIVFPVGAIPTNRITGTAVNLNSVQTITGQKTFSVLTTFTSSVAFLAGSISTNSISGTACNLSDSQTITGIKTFSVEPIIEANLRLEGSLVLSTNSTITQTQLEYLTGLTNDVQNSINALETKTANQTSSGSSTTFTGNTIVNDIVFNNTINTINTTTFGFISDLTSSAQFQINSINTKADNAVSQSSSALNTANSALALATTANGLGGTALAAATGAVATAGTALSSASAANSRCTALEGRVDNHDGDIGGLEVKTTRMSYNSGTSRTTFTNTLQANSFQFTSLTSGFNQTVTDAITIRGATEVRNTLSITNGSGLNVDGGIQQLDNSPNAYNGTVTCNNNFTASGNQCSLNATAVQIGITSLETLTVNSPATFNNDITMVAGKKLTIKNIVPLNLDDIYFGGEAGGYVNYNCYFNMKATFYEKVTIIDEVAIGTLAFRAPLTSYNTTIALDASSSIDISSSTMLTIGAPINNIGLVIGVNYLRGITYISSLATTSGVISAVNSAIQQF